MNPPDLVVGALMFATVVCAAADLRRTARLLAWLIIMWALFLPEAPDTFGMYALRVLAGGATVIAAATLMFGDERVDEWWKRTISAASRVIRGRAETHRLQE